MYQMRVLGSPCFSLETIYTNLQPIGPSNIILHTFLHVNSGSPSWEKLFTAVTAVSSLEASSFSITSSSVSVSVVPLLSWLTPLTLGPLDSELESVTPFPWTDWLESSSELSSPHSAAERVKTWLPHFFLQHLIVLASPDLFICGFL